MNIIHRSPEWAPVLNGSFDVFVFFFRILGLSFIIIENYHIKFKPRRLRNYESGTLLYPIDAHVTLNIQELE